MHPSVGTHLLVPLARAFPVCRLVQVNKQVNETASPFEVAGNFTNFFQLLTVYSDFLHIVFQTPEGQWMYLEHIFIFIVKGAK